MHSKVVDPSRLKNSNYDNKGSCLRLINYLEKDQNKLGIEVTKYFSSEAEDISKEDVHYQIDNNVKGLGKNDPKFTSLIISPSQEELEHIGDDHGKLKRFVEQTMENYADNFKFRNGKSINGKDLLWFGKIHQFRTYKNIDPEVRSGKAKEGDLKTGLNTHVHVTVSNRDKNMKLTINPIGAVKKFSISNWAKSNAASFDRMFGFNKSLAAYQNMMDERTSVLVEKINNKFSLSDGYLTKEGVKKMLESNDYDYKVYHNLKKLSQELGSGKFVNNVSEFLDGSNQSQQRTKGVGDQFEEIEKGKSFQLDFGRIFDNIKIEDNELDFFTKRRKRKNRNKNQDL